jgi:hypothetical protein
MADLTRHMQREWKTGDLTQYARAVRAGFVHEASIELAPDSDERAPGAAVTAALCGHWEHEGMCRWPHHTSVDVRSGQSVRLRVVFASAVRDEPAVRRLICAALNQGRLGAEPGTSRWAVIAQGQCELRPAEAPLTDRLLGI